MELKRNNSFQNQNEKRCITKSRQYNFVFKPPLLLGSGIYYVS
jgi:hypothetical protein